VPTIDPLVAQVQLMIDGQSWERVRAELRLFKGETDKTLSSTATRGLEVGLDRITQKLKAAIADALRLNATLSKTRIPSVPNIPRTVIADPQNLGQARTELRQFGEDIGRVFSGTSTRGLEVGLDRVLQKLKLSTAEALRLQAALVKAGNIPFARPPRPGVQTGGAVRQPQPRQRTGRARNELAGLQSKANVLANYKELTRGAKSYAEALQILRNHTEAVKKPTQELQQQFLKTRNSALDVERGLKSAFEPGKFREALSFFGRIATFSIVAGAIVRSFFAIENALTSLVSKGIEFNGQLESSITNIAVLLASTREIEDNQGRVVSAAEALPFIFQKAGEFQKRLFEDSLKGAETYEEIAGVYQQILVYGGQQVATDEERLQLAHALADLSAIINQRGQKNITNARQILEASREQGNVLPGVLGLTFKQTQELHKQGLLIKEILKRHKEVAPVLEKQRDTFAILTSTAEDLKNAIAGDILRDEFEGFKSVLDGFNERIQELRNAGGLGGALGLTEDELKQMGRDIADITVELVKFLRALIEISAQAADLVGVKNIFLGIAGTVGVLATVLGGVLLINMVKATREAYKMAAAFIFADRAIVTSFLGGLKSTIAFLGGAFIRVLGLATAAVRVLTAALLANPWTALAVAVGLAGVAIYKYWSAAREAQGATQDQTNDIDANTKAWLANYDAQKRAASVKPLSGHAPSNVNPLSAHGASGPVIQSEQKAPDYRLGKSKIPPAGDDDAAGSKGIPFAERAASALADLEEKAAAAQRRTAELIATMSEDPGQILVARIKEINAEIDEQKKALVKQFYKDLKGGIPAGAEAQLETLRKVLVGQAIADNLKDEEKAAQKRIGLIQDEIEAVKAKAEAELEVARIRAESRKADRENELDIAKDNQGISGRPLNDLQDQARLLQEISQEELKLIDIRKREQEAALAALKANEAVLRAQLAGVDAAIEKNIALLRSSGIVDDALEKALRGTAANVKRPIEVEIQVNVSGQDKVNAEIEAAGGIARREMDKTKRAIDDLNTTIIRLNDPIANFFGNISDAFTKGGNLFKNIKSAFKTLSSDIKSAMSDAFRESLKKKLNFDVAFKGNILDLGNFFTGTFKKAFDYVGGLFGSAGGSGQGGFFSGITNFLSGAFGGGSGTGSGSVGATSFLPNYSSGTPAGGPGVIIDDFGASNGGGLLGTLFGSYGAGSTPLPDFGKIPETTGTIPGAGTGLPPYTYKPGETIDPGTLKPAPTTGGLNLGAGLAGGVLGHTFGSAAAGLLIDSSKQSRLGGDIGGGVGGAIGFALGGPAGAAAGSFLGSFFGSLLGSLFAPGRIEKEKKKLTKFFEDILDLDFKVLKEKKVAKGFGTFPDESPAAIALGSQYATESKDGNQGTIIRFAGQGLGNLARLGFDAEEAQEALLEVAQAMDFDIKSGIGSLKSHISDGTISLGEFREELKEAKKNLKEYGDTSDLTAQQLSDLATANGNTGSNIVTINDIIAGTIDLYAEFNDFVDGATVANTYLADSFLDTARATNLFNEDIEALAGKIEDGTLSIEEAVIQLNRFRDEAGLPKLDLEDFKISAKEIQELVDIILTAVETMRGAIKSGIDLGIQGADEGEVAKSVRKAVYKSMVDAVSEGMIDGIIKGALAAGPLAEAFTNIADLTSKFVAGDISEAELFAGITTIFEEAKPAVEKLGTAVELTSEGLRQAYQNAGILGDILDDTAASAGGLADAVREGIDAFVKGGKIADVTTQIRRDIYTSIYESVLSGFVNGFIEAAAFAGPLKDAMAGVADLNEDFLKGTITQAQYLEGVRTVFTGLAPVVETIATATGIAAEELRAMLEAAGILDDIMGDVADSTLDVASALSSAGKTSLLSGITEQLDTDEVIDVFRREFYTSIVDTIAQAFIDGMIKGIVTSESLKGFQEFFGNLTSGYAEGKISKENFIAELRNAFNAMAPTIEAMSIAIGIGVEELTALFEEFGILDDILGDTGESAKELAKNLRQAARDLLLDPALSPLKPKERLTQNQLDFERLRAQALAGDKEAAEKLPEAARQYLEEARKVFASSLPYEQIFDYVRGTLLDVANIFGPLESVEDQQLYTLKEIRDELKRIGSAFYGDLDGEGAFTGTGTYKPSQFNGGKTPTTGPGGTPGTNPNAPTTNTQYPGYPFADPNKQPGRKWVTGQGWVEVQSGAEITWDSGTNTYYWKGKALTPDQVQQLLSRPLDYVPGSNFGQTGPVETWNNNPNSRPPTSTTTPYAGTNFGYTGSVDEWAINPTAATTQQNRQMRGLSESSPYTQSSANAGPNIAVQPPTNIPPTPHVPQRPFTGTTTENFFREYNPRLEEMNQLVEESWAIIEALKSQILANRANNVSYGVTDGNANISQGNWINTNGQWSYYDPWTHGQYANPGNFNPTGTGQAFDYSTIINPTNTMASGANFGYAGPIETWNINPLQNDVIFAATGFQGVVDRPQMFVAGEAGREYVSITPMSGGAAPNISNQRLPFPTSAYQPAEESGGIFRNIKDMFANLMRVVDEYGHLPANNYVGANGNIMQYNPWGTTTATKEYAVGVLSGSAASGTSPGSGGGPTGYVPQRPFTGTTTENFYGEYTPRQESLMESAAGSQAAIEALKSQILANRANNVSYGVIDPNARIAQQGTGQAATSPTTGENGGPTGFVPQRPFTGTTTENFFREYTPRQASFMESVENSRSIIEALKPQILANRANNVSYGITDTSGRISQGNWINTNGQWSYYDPWTHGQYNNPGNFNPTGTQQPFDYSTIINPDTTGSPSSLASGANFGYSGSVDKWNINPTYSLARGGIVKAPEVSALLHGPEAVIPLNSKEEINVTYPELLREMKNLRLAFEEGMNKYPGNVANFLPVGTPQAFLGQTQTSVQPPNASVQQGASLAAISQQNLVSPYTAPVLNQFITNFAQPAPTTTYLSPTPVTSYESQKWTWDALGENPPGFAEGGIITAPEMPAMLHGPEAVIPLPHIGAAIDVSFPELLREVRELRSDMKHRDTQPASQAPVIAQGDIYIGQEKIGRIIDDRVNKSSQSGGIRIPKKAIQG
jgi:glucan-binding YG repeat protein